MRSLLVKLREKCKNHLFPGQNIAVDERMVKSIGRFICKQCVRLKPVKWGFKMWVLADSNSGYTWNFQVYRGKQGETVSSNGLGFDVVLKLVDSLEKQEFVVYTDNFYSSPALYEELVKQGFGAVGTINPTRENCPKSLTLQKKQCYQKNVGNCVQSLERQVVCVASALHTDNSENKVKRRVKDQNGRFVEALVDIPNAIYDYNRFMGGVDLSGQLLQYYQTRRQTHKYWKTFFYHCIDI